MIEDISVTVLIAAVGLLWMFVNTKTERTSPLRTVSYFLMWFFLAAATGSVVRIAWSVLL